jgi:hypothetical protein
MSTEDVWKLPCHQGVEWERVKKEVFLLERSLPHFSNPEPTTVLIGLCFVVLEEITVGLIRDSFKEIYGKVKKNFEERRELRNIRKNLFPFFIAADLFVGTRYPWFDEVERKVSPRDLKSIGGVIDGFISTLCSLINKKPSTKLIQGKVDFLRNLIAVGGPIPNWYVRNLMYASNLDLPYKFRLDVTPELQTQGPDQLRRVGYEVVKSKPPWYIANRDGTIAETDYGEETKPILDSSAVIKDFFMIIKAPNVFPGAESTQALVLAGCHGLGTWAAGLALKNYNFLKTIEKEAGRGYFQVIGSVCANKKGQPDEETIEIGRVKRI